MNTTTTDIHPTRQQAARHQCASHAAALRHLNHAIWRGIGGPADPCAAARTWIRELQSGDDSTLPGHRLARLISDLHELALSGSLPAALTLHEMFSAGYGVNRSKAFAWTWILCAHHLCPRSDYPNLAEIADQLYRLCWLEFSPRARRDGERLLRAMLGIGTK